MKAARKVSLPNDTANKYDQLNGNDLLILKSIFETVERYFKFVEKDKRLGYELADREGSKFRWEIRSHLYDDLEKIKQSTYLSRSNLKRILEVIVDFGSDLNTEGLYNACVEIVRSIDSINSSANKILDDQFATLVIKEYRNRQFIPPNHKTDSSAVDEKLTYNRHHIPEKVRIEVWRRDDGKCTQCGSRKNLEYDHIVPISKGGSNTARNIELLCEACNRKKSNHIA